MTGRFLATLAARPLLLDAAMGTRLIARGLDLARDDPALWNLDHPEAVAAVHALDITTGSDALVANTFGANASWLARFGRAAEVDAINRRAVAIAREVAGPTRFVLGSIGPAWGSESSLLGQAESLAGAGVDAILVETHTSPRAVLALAAIRPVLSPILVGLCGPVEAVDLLRLADLGAMAVGSNCGTIGAARRLARSVGLSTSLPGLSKPGGGLPERPPVRPDRFAASVPGLLARGVRLFGGCCGTTEAHVAALRVALDRASFAGYP